MRHLKKFENIDSSDIEFDIRDIIQCELFLRDVPYSMQENEKEIDPESLDEAAKKVIEYLKQKDII